MAQDNHLKPAEVAKRLNVSNRTLTTWRERGQGPAFLDMGPRTVRYTEADVKAYEDRVRMKPKEVA